MIYISDIDYISDKIKIRIEQADKVIFDGSFFKKNELMRQKNIPHPPIMESIEIFGKQSENNFYFTHFNHSNPVLDKNSNEFKYTKDFNYKILNDKDEIEF